MEEFEKKKENVINMGLTKILTISNQTLFSWSSNCKKLMNHLKNVSQLISIQNL